MTAYNREVAAHPGAKRVSVMDKTCLCTQMRNFELGPRPHGLSAKDTTRRDADGTYRPLTAEHVFKDYLYSKDNTILLPRIFHCHSWRDGRSGFDRGQGVKGTPRKWAIPNRETDHASSIRHFMTEDHIVVADDLFAEAEQAVAKKNLCPPGRHSSISRGAILAHFDGEERRSSRLRSRTGGDHGSDLQVMRQSHANVALPTTPLAAVSGRRRAMWESYLGQAGHPC